MALVLLAACAGPSGRVGPATPAPTGPTNPAPAASTISPTTAATASSSASSVSRVVAFPDLDVLVGTSNGDLYKKLVGGQPAGSATHVCDGYVVRLETDGPSALVSCIQGSTFSVYTYDPRMNGTNAVVRVGGVDGPAVWAETGDAVVYVTRGSCAQGALDCASRLARRDLRTGAVATIDERVGVVTDIRSTEEGVTVWRARVGLGSVRPDAEVGTYLLRGTTLTKFSDRRLVAGTNGRWLLESEETDSYNSGCCTYVIQRAATETRLTPPDVTNERAVALLEDGRSVAFRPVRDVLTGTMVIYSATGGRVEGTDQGTFAAFRIVRAAPDWIVGFEYAGAPSLTLRGYRISDGAFASAPGGAITALALLPK